MKAAPHKLRLPNPWRSCGDGRLRRNRPKPAKSKLPKELRAAIDKETAELIHRLRAEQRRQLYRSDPIWRLSKLKDNRERRLRAKRRRELEAAELAELEAARQALRAFRRGERRQRAPYHPRADRRPARVVSATAHNFRRATAAADCQPNVLPLVKRNAV